ncbi:MAG: hypothetical protein GY805_04455 [Chloroflexi bacterium]|nr:hypothetical protein [Chloroflexota bacterium]
MFRTVGPWHGGGDFSSIDRDGVMEIEQNEWSTSTEFLDDDKRPSITQSLWASWDSEAAFFAWQGASWGPDGTMWIYMDIAVGGTNQAISGTAVLPFEADVAINVVGSETANRWAYNSGTNSWEIHH